MHLQQMPGQARRWWWVILISSLLLGGIGAYQQLSKPTQYAAKVTAEGLCGVQGKSFFELVRKLPPGEISLTLDEA